MGQSNTKSKRIIEDDQYDVSIEINGLRELEGPGWPVRIAGKSDFLASELINQSERRNLMFVGVLGLYNRGKTFILNKLAQTKLPEGFATHTAGISFMHPRNNPCSDSYMLVDIAGFGSPISHLDEESVQGQYLKDRFIQELVVRLCYVFIVVVNDMTLEDQLFIDNLRVVLSDLTKTEKYGKKYDDVIVIHNYSKITQQYVMEIAFDDQILQHYKDGNYINSSTPRYWHTKPTPNKSGIRHLPVLCEPAVYPGFPKTYNQQVWELISGWLAGCSQRSETKNPVIDFLRHGNEVLVSYLANPLELKLRSDDNNTDPRPCICWPPFPTTSTLVKPIDAVDGESFFKKGVFSPKYFVPPERQEVSKATINSTDLIEYDILYSNTDVYVLIELPGLASLTSSKPTAEEAPFDDSSNVSFRFDPAVSLLTIIWEKKRPEIYKVTDIGKRTTSNRRFLTFEKDIDLKSEVPGSPALKFSSKELLPGGVVKLQFLLQNVQEL